jgi:glycosyl transferase family 25
MKSFIINLDRRPDRLKDITEVFKRSNIEFMRVSAVDGKEYAKTLDDWKYSLTPPEVGCFYSHIKCFELIAAGCDEYGVVFEDDVILSRHASYYLNDISWIPADADIIKLETTSENKKVRLVDIQSLPVGGVKIARLRSMHCGTGAYIISKRMAQLIINRISSPTLPIDVLLFMPGPGPLTDLEVYQLTPAICKQKLLESTIDVERSEWHALEVEERRRNKAPISFGLRIIREIKRPIYRLKARLIEWRGAVLRLTRIGRSWMKIPFQ